jgi:hypothetical protein
MTGGITRRRREGNRRQFGKEMGNNTIQWEGSQDNLERRKERIANSLERRRARNHMTVGKIKMYCKN